MEYNNVYDDHIYDCFLTSLFDKKCQQNSMKTFITVTIDVTLFWISIWKVIAFRIWSFQLLINLQCKRSGFLSFLQQCFCQFPSKVRYSWGIIFLDFKWKNSCQRQWCYGVVKNHDFNCHVKLFSVFLKMQINFYTITWITVKKRYNEIQLWWKYGD